MQLSREYDGNFTKDICRDFMVGLPAFSTSPAYDAFRFPADGQLFVLVRELPTTGRLPWRRAMERGEELVATHMFSFLQHPSNLVAYDVANMDEDPTSCVLAVLEQYAGDIPTPQELLLGLLSIAVASELTQGCRC